MAFDVSLWIWLEWYTDWIGSLQVESLILRLDSISLFCDLAIETLPRSIAISIPTVLDDLPRSVASHSAFISVFICGLC